MKQAREVALDALTACERQGAWSDGYLKKAIGGAKLDGRDAALATRLCFGVLQNRMLLDFYLSKLCATPLHKLEASIRNLLRLGAYQLLYLNRVPDHAAVSEAVSLGKKKRRWSRPPTSPPGTAILSGWWIPSLPGWAERRRRPCWPPTTASPPPVPR